MKTLDSWESRLTAIPSVIECPEMQLLGWFDHEPPVFVGPGHIDIRSSTTIDFTMFAQAADVSDALRRLACARENPYEVKAQFRLFATDYQGTEWACGWTSPRIKDTRKTTGFPLIGKLNSLVAIVSGRRVSQSSGVELVFQPGFWLPMDRQMESVYSVDGFELLRRYSAGKHTVNVLDSEITFFYKPDDKALWATANTSNKLPHPHLENWIGEPFRILLGQPVYPRLVARNFGDGKAQVSLRPSPGHYKTSGIAALFREPLGLKRQEFWNLYARILTLIAAAKDEHGLPNLSSHEVTRYYEEIIQATQGSRWVLCMTLAGAAEGLAKMLMQPSDRKSDFDAEEIARLKAMVEAWDGSTNLKSRVLSWFPHLQERSVSNYLRRLVGRGVLKKENESAWAAVRNQVMHGNLVSPWGSKEEDERMVALAELVHSLTREITREPGPQAEQPF